MAHYWRASTAANWGTLTGNWSTDPSTFVQAAALPTAADDVIFDANSGANCTIAATAYCRSIDMSGYVSGRVLTHNNSVDLYVGDASGGALNYTGAWTLTIGGTSAYIRFVSTSDNSGAGWNVNTGGHNMPGVRFAGAGGKWILQSNFAQYNTACLFYLDGGTFDANNYNVSFGTFDGTTGTISRTLNMGSGTFTCNTFTNGNWNALSNYLTINCGTSTLQGCVAGCAFSNHTYYTIKWSSAGGSFIFFGSCTNLYTSSDVMSQYSFTVTGGLYITGSDGGKNRALVSGGITITLGASATFKSTSKNLDLANITITGGAAGERDWSTGSPLGVIGDAGGNSGVVFTPATTTYWVGGTTNGMWGTAARWSVRVPLPQDTARINIAFSAGIYIGADYSRLAKHIDFTGSTGGVGFIINTGITYYIYGSLTLVAGMWTYSSYTSSVLSFVGTEDSSITSAGVNITFPYIDVSKGAAKVTLQDNLTCATFRVTTGTVDFNGKNLTAAAVSIPAGSTTRSLINTAAWTLSGTSPITNAATAFSTFTAPTILNLTSTGTSSAVMGAFAYNDIVVTPTGTLTFSNNFTFNNMTMSTSGTKTVKFNGGSNVTTTGTQFLAGSASGNITVTSTTTTPFTLTKNSGLPVKTDYLTLSYSTFASSGGVKGYAGSHSTNGGNNTGWTFADAPILGNALMFGDLF